MKIVLEKKPNWNEQFRPFAMVLPLNFEKDGYFFYKFAMGSFDFVHKCAYQYGALAWGNTDKFLWSNYAPQIGSELLNSDYCMLPASELERLKYSVLAHYAADCKVFVRPNRGDKTFDGQILDIENFYEFTKHKNELVIIAKPKEILGEWRFAVCDDGTILGLSLYRYQGNHVEIASCPAGMSDYVQNIVKKMLDKPQKAFTVDVAQLPDMSFKVIELNALSTSGLYAMKPEPIVEFIQSL